MSREIKYKAIESYGDCTTKFEIQGVDGMRVSEFISCIISNRLEDSGTFTIDGVKFPYDNKRGFLSINTDQAPCHLTIASVTAHGAYWLMDYDISTKNTTKPTMSRTTIFKEGAWIGGYEYSDKNTLQRDIGSKEADVNYYKEKLLALCCATPKDITPKDGDPLHFVTREFEDVWDELQEVMFSLAAMYFIQHNEGHIDMGEEPQ